MMCFVTNAALGCGGRGDPCKVPLGEYFAAWPQAQSQVPRSAIVRFHGAGSEGADVVEDTAMVNSMTERNYIVIAPQGLSRSEFGNGWTFRTDHVPPRDELAFLREVLVDAASRFNIDRQRVLVTGESVGGSLVWYLACRAPSEFAAFAPVMGGFWRPFPEHCNGPVRMLHTHGWTDSVVPLEGRKIVTSQVMALQGHIMEGLEIWRRVNRCNPEATAHTIITDKYWSRTWDDCAPGSALQFVLYPGGHQVPAFWPKLVMDWFEIRP